MLGLVACSLAIVCGFQAIRGSRYARAMQHDFVRATTMSPIEWSRFRAQRQSAYQRWARPVLVLWSRRLHLRPARVDRLFLIQAGMDPDRFDGVELQAIRVAGALTGAGVATALSLVSPSLIVSLPLLVWLGYIAPIRYLASKRHTRQRLIQMELPDFIGLVRAFVSAGMPLERALDAIAAQPASLPLLASEVRLALTRYGLGVGVEDALEEMAQRLGTEDVSLFVGALTQTKRLGSGLDPVLREQELIVRLNQRHRATAEASRIGTKLLGVLAGVYLPEFVILIMVPLFWGIIRRAFG